MVILLIPVNVSIRPSPIPAAVPGPGGRRAAKIPATPVIIPIVLNNAVSLVKQGIEYVSGTYSDHPSSSFTGSPKSSNMDGIWP
jgi:hypothetical protein